MSILEKEIICRILANIKIAQGVIDDVVSIKNRLIPLALSGELREKDFYKISSMLTPQSRSPLWEKYFILKNNCERIGAQESNGDFKKNGIFYEYKASGFNLDNALHIVQIRLFHECDYLIQSITDSIVYTFKLTHNQMKNETKLLKASVAHGTNITNKNNANLELRMTIYKESKEWNRWIKEYSVNSDVLF